MDSVVAFLTSILGLLIPGFGSDGAPRYSGYVEADYVYVAPASSGVIATIAVREGEVVAAGAPLFALRDSQQLSLLSGAEARWHAAQAALDNLTTGSREDELAVVRASLARAVAERDLADDSATRSEKLFKDGVVPRARLDQDKAALASASAQVQQLEAQLKVSELPARDAQQRQAEANLSAAAAEVDKARADLDDRRVTAPVAGQVDKLFYDPGEMGMAGQPVVALLASDGLKVKFYMPEADRPGFALGDSVAVSCDGCAAGLIAEISQFAFEPQFTPPVIYSRQERQRMSFLVEAQLPADASLPPGQPVTVEPVP